MKIPKQLKIGGTTYKVIVVEDWFGRDDADGQMFNDVDMGNCIYIASHLTDEAKAVTLIHEALHCMNSTMNHEFLDSLAEQLYQMFSDNGLLK